MEETDDITHMEEITFKADDGSILTVDCEFDLTCIDGEYCGLWTGQDIVINSYSIEGSEEFASFGHIESDCLDNWIDEEIWGELRRRYQPYDTLSEI